MSEMEWSCLNCEFETFSAERMNRHIRECHPGDYGGGLYEGTSLLPAEITDPDEL